jgi:uncharacterized LabA/DUF88 family protein
LENIDEIKSLKIAMLVDGDNAQPSLLENMLEEVNKYGQITIRRIFGDFSESNMASWRDKLHENAFQPIQIYRYTKGKNATDNAMIIDAMDILHSNIVNGFCIVSSDSDYTRLATRIREAGIFVMGIGKKDTPKAFVNACRIFTHVENLLPTEIPVNNEPKTKQKGNKKKTNEAQDIILDKDKNDDTEDPTPLLLKAFDLAAEENGSATLANFGNCLRKLDPSFDVRTYKFKQLIQLVKSKNDIFTLQHSGDNSTIYISLKN